MKNRLYLWSGYGFLLAVAIGQYAYTQSTTTMLRQELESTPDTCRYFLDLPFGMEIPGGLTWMIVFPVIWFLAALILNKRAATSTTVAVVYAVTALVAAVAVTSLSQLMRVSMSGEIP